MRHANLLQFMEVFIPNNANTMCYGIIGNGKMAKHFIHYLTLLQFPYQQWTRDQSSESLVILTQRCSPILLLINDDAIESFIEQHPCLQGKLLVHFSGAIHVKNAYGAHPLLCFSQELYTLETYKKIPFIYEENAPEFQSILPGLKNPHFKIPIHLKSFYHAICVLSGNFTVILWQKFFSEFENTFHIPKEQAHLFLQQTMQNLLTDPQHALTGPLSRKDTKTIETHLATLKNDPFQKVYQAFLETHR